MKTLTIKELIDTIKNYGTTKENGNFKYVMFDFCNAVPINLCSWRDEQKY